MSYTMVVSVLLYCVLLWTVVDSYNYRVDIMEDHCPSGIQGKYNIDMAPSDAAGKLVLSRGIYRPNLNCEYTVKAPAGKKLIVTFNWINIHGRWGYACGGDYLKIYNDRILIGESLCGYYHRPAVTFIIKSGIARFQMVSDNDYVDRTGFELTYTAFHDGRCSQPEFRCRSGICIDQQLKCDSNDNCGDWSDDSCSYAKCKCNLSAGAIVGIVFACLFIAVMCITAILCCCRANKRAREAANKPPTMQAHVIAVPRQAAHQPMVMTTTTPYQPPVTMNQAYGGTIAYDNPPPYPGTKQ